MRSLRRHTSAAGRGRRVISARRRVRPAALRALAAGALLLAGLGRGAFPAAAQTAAPSRPAAAGRPVPATRPSSDAAELCFQAGERKLAAGEVAAAIAALREACERRPAEPRYLVRLADALEADGRAAEGARLLERFLMDQPAADAAAQRLARYEAKSARWNRVEALLAGRVDRLDAESTTLLAQALRSAEKPARADAALAAGLKRFPQDDAIWMAYIEAAVDRGQCATALERIRAARVSPAARPRLTLLTARCYFELGKVLGQTQVRTIRDGRCGQVAGEWLPIEERGERFLCAPAESALYQLRRALDAGIDDREAHLLHARIWLKAGRPATAWEILKAQEARLIEEDDPAVLATLSEVALAAGSFESYLRYAGLAAQRAPQRKAAILHDAFRAVAERYSQRGDEAMHREFLRRALEQKADDAECMVRLADALWDADQRAEAGRWYRTALERDPAHASRSEILERLSRLGQDGEEGR